MITIETDRLILRPVADSDAAPTARLMTAGISRNLSSWVSPLSVEDARARIGRSAQMLEDRRGFDLAITRKSDSPVMGWIGMALTAPGCAQLGYWLGEDFQGQGFAKEAVGAVTKEGAAFLGATEIRAQVMESNRRSIAVLETTGFSHCGAEIVFAVAKGREELCLRFSRTLKAA